MPGQGRNKERQWPNQCPGPEKLHGALGPWLPCNSKLRIRAWHVCTATPTAMPVQVTLPFSLIVRKQESSTSQSAEPSCPPFRTPPPAAQTTAAKATGLQPEIPAGSDWNNSWTSISEYWRLAIGAVLACFSSLSPVQATQGLEEDGILLGCVVGFKPVEPSCGHMLAGPPQKGSTAQEKRAIHELPKVHASNRHRHGVPGLAIGMQPEEDCCEGSSGATGLTWELEVLPWHSHSPGKAGSSGATEPARVRSCQAGAQSQEGKAREALVTCWAVKAPCFFLFILQLMISEAPAQRAKQTCGRAEQLAWADAMESRPFECAASGLRLFAPPPSGRTLATQ